MWASYCYFFQIYFCQFILDISLRPHFTGTETHRRLKVKKWPTHTPYLSGHLREFPLLFSSSLLIWLHFFLFCFVSVCVPVCSQGFVCSLVGRSGKILFILECRSNLQRSSSVSQEKICVSWQKHGMLCYCHILTMKEEHNCQEPKIWAGSERPLGCNSLVTNTIFFPLCVLWDLLIPWQCMFIRHNHGYKQENVPLRECSRNTGGL